jgi:hypothetical protein
MLRSYYEFSVGKGFWITILGYRPLSRPYNILPSRLLFITMTQKDCLCSRSIDCHFAATCFPGHAVILALYLFGSLYRYKLLFCTPYQYQ